MNCIRAILASCIFSVTLVFAGCNSASETANGANRTNSNGRPNGIQMPQPKTNAEELGVLISIPFEAEDVVWQHDEENGRITAFLRFTTADIEKIISQSIPSRGDEEASIEVETWFPEELIAQGEISGDGTLKGKQYSPNVFLQSPFANGRLIRISGVDYLYLEVGSK